MDFGHFVPAVLEEDRAHDQRRQRKPTPCGAGEPVGLRRFPESLRRLQLENGAEIGRAIVNFDGPIVFIVVSRYHGGAFVVFSQALNENMEVLAVEGSFSSVIGGAPAAAVVFTRDVNARTAADPAVRELEAQLADSTDDAASAGLRVKLADTRTAVRSDKLGEVAAEFEAVHNVERARQMGSVHRIIPAAELRPSIAAALERGWPEQWMSSVTEVRKGLTRRHL